MSCLRSGVGNSGECVTVSPPRFAGPRIRHGTLAYFFLNCASNDE